MLLIMENKNYIGCLVSLNIPEVEDLCEKEEILYTVFKQEENKLILQRTDTNKEMTIPISWLEKNKQYFRVL